MPHTSTPLQYLVQLFLLGNMISCTSALSVLSGLPGMLHPYIGGASMVFSCIFSIFCTSGEWVHVCMGSGGCGWEILCVASCLFSFFCTSCEWDALCASVGVVRWWLRTSQTPTTL